MSRRVLLLLIAAVLAPTFAHAWQVHMGTGYGDDSALAVAFDAERNVVAAGYTLLGGDTGTATVVKLSRSGRLVWKTLVAGDGSSSRSVAIDAAGDVFVGGLEGGIDESYQGHFTATKLAGATGAVLWRHAEPASFDGVLRLDPAGNAIVSAVEPGPDFGETYTCTKLAGADGSELWRNPACGMIRAAAAGDVVVSAGGTVRKIAGATGTDVWQTTLDVMPSLATTDGAGDVLLGADTALVKLDGATGALRWKVVDPALDGLIGGIQALAVDPLGDVVLAGTTVFQFQPLAGSDFVVVKRAGADGSERWRKTFSSDVVGLELARAVAVDRRGNVVAAGTLAGDATGNVCLIVRIEGASGKTRWTRGLRGTGRTCMAVALDPRGNFAVAGSALAPHADLASLTSATFVVARGTGWSGQGLRPVRIFP